MPQKPAMKPLRKKETKSYSCLMKPKIPLFESSNFAPSKWMAIPISNISRIKICANTKLKIFILESKTLFVAQNKAPGILARRAVRETTTLADSPTLCAYGSMIIRAAPRITTRVPYFSRLLTSLRSVTIKKIVVNTPCIPVRVYACDYIVLRNAQVQIMLHPN